MNVHKKKRRTEYVANVSMIFGVTHIKLTKDGADVERVTLPNATLISVKEHVIAAHATWQSRFGKLIDVVVDCVGVGNDLYEMLIVCRHDYVGMNVYKKVTNQGKYISVNVANYSNESNVISLVDEHGVPLHTVTLSICHIRVLSEHITILRNLWEKQHLTALDVEVNYEGRGRLLYEMLAEDALTDIPNEISGTVTFDVPETWEPLFNSDCPFTINIVKRDCKL